MYLETMQNNSIVSNKSEIIKEKVQTKGGLVTTNIIMKEKIENKQVFH